MIVGFSLLDVITFVFGNALFRCFSLTSGERGFFFASCECEAMTKWSALFFAANFFKPLTFSSCPLVGGFIRPKSMAKCLTFSSVNSRNLFIFVLLNDLVY